MENFRQGLMQSATDLTCMLLFNSQNSISQTYNHRIMYHAAAPETKTLLGGSSILAII